MHCILEIHQDAANSDIVWRSGIEQVLRNDCARILIRRAGAAGIDAVLRLTDVAVLNPVGVVSGTRAGNADRAAAEPTPTNVVALLLPTILTFLTTLFVAPSDPVAVCIQITAEAVPVFVLVIVRSRDEPPTVFDPSMTIQSAPLRRTRQSH